MNFNVIVLTTKACNNGDWRNVLHTRVVSHTQEAYDVHNVYFLSSMFTKMGIIMQYILMKTVCNKLGANTRGINLHH